MRDWPNRCSRIVLAILVAMAATYAVAWRCCIIGAERTRRGMYPPSLIQSAPSPSEMAWWRQHALPGMGTPNFSMGERDTGYEQVRLLVTGNNLPSHQIRRCRGGWPMLAIEGEEYVVPNAAGGKTIETRGMIGLLFLRPYGLAGLPARPAWPEFAIVSGGYAALIWAMLTAPGAIVRIVRRRRDQCPECGYLRGRNAVCTECGFRFAKSPPSSPS